MRVYDNKNNVRCIEFEHYLIKIRHSDDYVYCINIGRKADTCFDDVATYITAYDVGEAERRAMELLREYLENSKKEIEETLAELPTP